MNHQHRFSLPGGARLDASDIAAMLGVDPTRGRWSLWHQLRATPGLAPPQHARRTLAEHTRAAMLDWVAANASLGTTVRRGKKQIHARDLPLTVQVDLALGEQKSYGEGPGFGCVEWITSREWRREWYGSRVTPTVPAHVRAHVEATFLVLGTSWGIVIPQVGIDDIENPLLVRSDTRLRDRITEEMWRFARSLEEGREPEPDERADRYCLDQLARLCPTGRESERVLEGDDRDRALAKLEDAMQAQTALEEARAAASEANARYRAAMSRFMVDIEGHEANSVRIGRHRIRRTVSQRRTMAKPIADEVRYRIDTEQGADTPTKTLLDVDIAA